MKETYILLIIGTLGVFIHTLIKAQNLQKDMEKANLEFVFAKYLQKDWIGIFVSWLCVIAWLYLYPEAAIKYPSILNWLRGSFFAVAFIGSYAIQLWLSGSKKWLRKQIDVKTDKADGK